MVVIGRHSELPGSEPTLPVFRNLEAIEPASPDGTRYIDGVPVFVDPVSLDDLNASWIRVRGTALSSDPSHWRNTAHGRLTHAISAFSPGDIRRCVGAEYMHVLRIGI
jgi:hypothetical protein